MAAIRTRQRKAAVATALLGATLGLALLVTSRGSADEAEKSRAMQLGSTAHTPRPNCPTPPASENPPADKACQAMARVTGFQTEADGRHNPFKVRKPGFIVGWGISLSKPSKSEQHFFESEISKSGRPSARISIIKPKSDGRYKLIRQSPIVRLKSELGSKPIFTLTDPLKVKKGMFVALTTTTWVSNLADAGASGSDSWRASREDGQCLNAEDLLKRSRPQQKVGGIRTYACDYDGARILYWAYLAPRR
ncbi:MAG TPA: hypothetical protein VK326_05825 [Solirubrobacterales bacterium]|nr:hypothetical protein [Solirubrobacterales bacterium]